MAHKVGLLSRNTIFVVLLIPLFSVRAQDLSEMKVEGIYKNICSNCHGIDLKGGLSSSLADGQWEFGGSDEEILQTIKDGIPEKGMIAYGSVLSPDQLRSLVVYIRELEKAEQDNSITFPELDPDQVITTQHHDFRVEVLTKGLDTPWGLAFLPDGYMLVTERNGPLRVIDPNYKLVTKPVADTPPVIFDGPEGGMMDISLHPDYKNNGWIYLAFADGWRDENGKSYSQTAIVRGRIINHRWADQEWIYKADQKFYTRSGAHYGTRMAFDNGYLYFVVGERGAMGQAQDLNRPNGKIMRLYDDGRVPEDNPFINDAEVPNEIWSYGHRNPQGLVIDADTHTIYATEHGARGGDELNLILKGRNYGWPVITHGINYDGRPITPLTEKEGMEQPLLHWTPSIAPCGLTIYLGSEFSKWKGDLLAGSLRAQELRRIRLAENGLIVEQEVLLKGFGRIRDVRTGPDGLVYLLTDDPSRLFRIVPIDKP
ncbi:PQQ-dependent sugar dehydrogenase [Marinoscillum sp. MHG1-6]|uniref:PQQ-dependent sugar dehydrogenase n=1 Tax=Marinoscillum sp. MHG1-6 TaxID=2959627 RepID=UPI002157F67C|nr:PQQ-dependent sugar dehydrogenase [Marinoscillum sp. MHG1-6]